MNLHVLATVSVSLFLCVPARAQNTHVYAHRHSSTQQCNYICKENTFKLNEKHFTAEKVLHHGGQCSSPNRGSESRCLLIIHRGPAACKSGLL